MTPSRAGAGGTRTVHPLTLPARAPGEGAGPLRRGVFVDCETTGLTDEELRAERVDVARAGALLGRSHLVVAHNARFDRPFVEATAPAALKTELAWLRETVYRGYWACLPAGEIPTREVSAFERWRADPADLAPPAVAPRRFPGHG